MEDVGCRVQGAGFRVQGVTGLLHGLVALTLLRPFLLRAVPVLAHDKGRVQYIGLRTSGHVSDSKGYVDGFVGELTSAKRLLKHCVSLLRPLLLRAVPVRLTRSTVISTYEACTRI